jgi:hypothetical protein
MTPYKQRWHVQFGAEHWRRHTHDRMEQQGLQLLGSIARAGQFGALAQTADGDYVQINGDHITPLNRSQVARAIRIAQAAEQQRSHSPPRRAATSAPTIIVKRRRVVSPPRGTEPPVSPDA